MKSTNSRHGGPPPSRHWTLASAARALVTSLSPVRPRDSSHHFVLPLGLCLWSSRCPQLALLGRPAYHSGPVVWPPGCLFRVSAHYLHNLCHNIQTRDCKEQQLTPFPQCLFHRPIDLLRMVRAQVWLPLHLHSRPIYLLRRRTDVLAFRREALLRRFLRFHVYRRFRSVHPRDLCKPVNRSLRPAQVV